MIIMSTLKDREEWSFTEEKRWYCIYTKPRKEDFVSFQLSKVPGIEVLNPKFKRKRFLRGRFQEVIEELFPCYIFAKFNSHFYHMIKYTRGVKRVVGDRSGRPYIVDESIIDIINAHTRDDGYVYLIKDEEFKQGDTIMITDGPLKGLVGIFLREMKPQERVLVLLNAISYHVKIEIDRTLIRKV